VWSRLVSLFAVGVFAWGVRDLIAVIHLGAPEWQRYPMHIGTAANPRVVLVTGATGFVGRALTRALIARGDCVIALSRHPRRASDLFGASVPVYGSLSEVGSHRQIDAIVNLAGAPVMGWWTSAKRRRLVGSRLQTTEQVLDLMRRLQRNRPCC
jgi:NADPH:quinone reductase-like Zn-dependent oxidoreductase